MKTVIPLIPMAAFALVSCGTTTPAYDESAQWRTTDNGITVWSARNQIDTRHTWTGAVDKEKKAHGFGKLSQYNPDIPGDFLFGGGYYENTTEYEGKMVHGRFEGEVIRRMSYNGKVQRDQFKNGEWVSGEVISPRSTPTDSGSGLSDGQLVGGLIGLGGIAAGDTGVAGAGLTMLSGNESQGLQQMMNLSSGSTSSSAVGSLAGATASGQGKPAGTNLVDDWELRKTVKSKDDHMNHYIQAADAAFASYQKSGEKQYYDQHREYAQLARDFHERTGTETQGYAR